MRIARYANVVALVVTTVLAFPACASDEPADALPIAASERARSLTFFTIPSARTLSPGAFQAEEAADATLLSDAYVAYMRESYGRLGFFPRDFDLRASSAAQASLYAAYYNSETRSITLIGSPEPQIVVHELVHALQDQHFDLRALRAENVTTDEQMALRGLIEGDATMAQLRHEVWAHDEEPALRLGSIITLAEARTTSERGLAKIPGPAFFKAHPTFSYSYGAAFVANRLEIGAGSWLTRQVDTSFRRGGPSTTLEVLHGGSVRDIEAVPTGLSRLPPELASSHEVETVDRLGAWHTYLLFYPFPTGETGELMRDLVPAWRGDQFLVLRERDLSIPRRGNAPRGVMWSSVWRDESAAKAVEAHLTRIHSAKRAPETSENLYRAADGDDVWLGHVGETVVFIKNFAPEVMDVLARAMFETHDEKRLRTFRKYASDPRVDCLR